MRVATGPAAELEDARRLAEARETREFAHGAIFVEGLAVLPGADPVVDASGFSVCESSQGDPPFALEPEHRNTAKAVRLGRPIVACSPTTSTGR